MRDRKVRHAGMSRAAWREFRFVSGWYNRTFNSRLASGKQFLNTGRNDYGTANYRLGYVNQSWLAGGYGDITFYCYGGVY